MVQIQHFGLDLRPGPVKEADVLAHSAHYARIGNGCPHTARATIPIFSARSLIDTSPNSSTDSVSDFS